MFKAFFVLAALGASIEIPDNFLPGRSEPFQEQLLCEEPLQALSIAAYISEKVRAPTFLPTGCSKTMIKGSWVSAVMYWKTRNSYRIDLVTIRIPYVGERYSFSVVAVE